MCRGFFVGARLPEALPTCPHLIGLCGAGCADKPDRAGGFMSRHLGRGCPGKTHLNRPAQCIQDVIADIYMCLCIFVHVFKYVCI